MTAGGAVVDFAATLASILITTSGGVVLQKT